jgi:hypothetical protein
MVPASTIAPTNFVEVTHVILVPVWTKPEFHDTFHVENMIYTYFIKLIRLLTMYISEYEQNRKMFILFLMLAYFVKKPTHPSW